MNRTHTQKGFSMVELTVVIVIIGILATMAVPYFKSSVEKTKAREGMSFLHNVELQQARYMAETGAYARTLKELEGRMGETMETPEFFDKGAISSGDWETRWQLKLTRNGASSGFGRYSIMWNQDGFMSSQSSIPTDLKPAINADAPTSSCSGPIPSSRGIADPAYTQN